MDARTAGIAAQRPEANMASGDHRRGGCRSRHAFRGYASPGLLSDASDVVARWRGRASAEDSCARSRPSSLAPPSNKSLDRQGFGPARLFGITRYEQRPAPFFDDVFRPTPAKCRPPADPPDFEKIASDCPAFGEKRA